MAQVRKFQVNVVKVEQALGLVIGFAVICKVTDPTTGQLVDYYDTGSIDEASGELVQDHVSEDEMLRAVTEFAGSSRIAKEMHTGGSRGTVVHSFPLTSDIAKALGIETPTTGWLVAMRPDAAMLKRFQSGELTGFSIGGTAAREVQL